MADFRLQKWYFDCVSSDGSVLIGYAARLTWGPVGLSYGARITKPKGSPSSQRQSLALGAVDREGQTVCWSNDRLKVRGEWTGGSPVPNIVLVDGPSGCIEWQCLGANCAVNVHVDGRTMTGTGYAEMLSMTIPPWKIPFSELRWGRYISDDRDDFMVWTDLRGTDQRTWVWLNSGQAVAGTVDDHGVHTGGADLVFQSPELIRSDNVARTLFGRLEFLKNLLPEGVRAVQENKQVSSCALKKADSESIGSSINEVVTWGRA